MKYTFNERILDLRDPKARALWKTYEDDGDIVIGFNTDNERAWSDETLSHKINKMWEEDNYIWAEVELLNEAMGFMLHDVYFAPRFVQIDNDTTILECINMVSKPSGGRVVPDFQHIIRTRISS